MLPETFVKNAAVCHQISADKVASRYLGPCFDPAPAYSAIVTCTKPILGLYLDSRESTCQKLKIKVKWWGVSTGIATCWKHGSFDGIETQKKRDKRCHFEMVALLGLEHFRYGQTRLIVIRQLGEGRLHWDCVF